MPPNQGRGPGRTIPGHADPLPNAQHSLIHIRHLITNACVPRIKFFIYACTGPFVCLKQQPRRGLLIRIIRSTIRTCVLKANKRRCNIKFVDTMGVVQDGANKLVGLAKTWGYYGWIPVTIYLGQSSTVACSLGSGRQTARRIRMFPEEGCCLVCVCASLSS